MRFTRRPRCEYIVTERKRAAAARWQQRQRDSLPLLAPLIAAAQPSVEQVMAERVAHWAGTEQEWRDRRAEQWRQARRLLDGQEPVPRRALLAYWNGHRWLPGDPSYLLDMLHGFHRPARARGRGGAPGRHRDPGESGARRLRAGQAAHARLARRGPGRRRRTALTARGRQP